jgi:hypothetical protein
MHNINFKICQFLPYDVGLCKSCLIQHTVIISVNILVIICFKLHTSEIGTYHKIDSKFTGMKAE